MLCVTVVYLDTFLLINFTLNYLLLLASGKLAGEPIRKLRFALAALFGALYAACSFFPGLSFSLHPLYKISVALLMLLISFGRTRSLLRISVVFLAISCAFCGGILAIEWLKGSGYMQDGIVYSSLDVKGLFMSAIFCYGVLALFFRRSALHHISEGELLDVRFVLQGKEVALIALQDSGNTLQDPLSGRDVPVAEGERLGVLFPEGMTLDRAALEHPIDTLEQIAKAGHALRFRLLPYRAVGVECGMLLALRVDCMYLGKEKHRNQLIALSPTPLSDGGAYSVLVGTHCTTEKREEVSV